MTEKRTARLITHDNTVDLEPIAPPKPMCDIAFTVYRPFVRYTAFSQLAKVALAQLYQTGDGTNFVGPEEGLAKATDYLSRAGLKIERCYTIAERKERFPYRTKEERAERERKLAKKGPEDAPKVTTKKRRKVQHD